MGIEDKVDYEKLRAAGIPVAVSPASLVHGFDGPILPQGKSWNVKALLEKLDKEQFPWNDKATYKITHNVSWGVFADGKADITGETDYLLVKNEDTPIAYLIIQEGTKYVDPHFTGILPFDSITYGELKYILEVTGWELIS